MTALSLQTLHALGWTLLHFVWQGAALAALLAAALMVSRNANVRYALGIGTLILMTAAPVITFAWLNRAPAPATTIEVSEIAPASDVMFTSQSVSPADPLVHALAARTSREDMMLWLVQAWFVGVMLLSVRTGGGLLWLARTRRGEIEPLSPEMHRQCLLLQERMGLRRHIRYGLSHGLDSPVVIGWFRPVVVMTAQAITGLSPQQLQAIIAHELAHIRRHDAFVNVFQVVAEMFLFYQPAVWWVSRRIRIEREVCCDHEALAACGEPVSYARALTMMEEWRAAPSMMMAANRSPLAERVLRLLGVQGTSARSRVAGLGACVVGVAAALFAGSVFVAAAQATTDDQPSPQTSASPAPAPVAAPAPAAAPEPQPAPRPRVAVEPKPPVPPRPAQEERSPREEVTYNKSSYIEGIDAAGLRNVSIDEVIAMKVQGITPAYIKSMLATQLQPEVHELIAMKVHDVTPEYVDAIRRVLADVEVEDVIAMRVHSVTPQFIQQMQAAGLDIRIAEDLIAAKVHEITPELVKSAIEHGFQDLTIPKLIMLRNIDVI
jgi:beta-lactamase regulating signal transducer with metallopeptidase domain